MQSCNYIKPLKILSLLTFSPFKRDQTAKPSERFRIQILTIAWLVYYFFSSNVTAQEYTHTEWDSQFSFEYRYFPSEGFDNQAKDHPSIAWEGDYYSESGNRIFRFSLYLRADKNNPDRNLIDIRELSWRWVFDDWELLAGISKVFWGVTESQHLVDIINQTDSLERPDGEEKFGQPMIGVSLSRDWGILDINLMTGFRSRKFSSSEGRLRFPITVDAEIDRIESAANHSRFSVAARWWHSIGNFDFALSHFSGISRVPRFDLVTDNFVGESRLSFAPVYEVIDQSGLELQYIYGEWLWKLEAISNSGFDDRYFATTAGFERTIVGIFDSRVDLGLIAEYSFDDRKRSASNFLDDDLALGMRWALNDVSNTQVLIVGILDQNSSEKLISMEASRRLSDNWSVVLEATFFDSKPIINAPPSQFLKSLEMGNYKLSFLDNDSFLKLELIRYF